MHLSVCHGDITYETSDAIVCPANNFLQFHGGVAACILKRGGKSIIDETEHIVKENIMVPTGSVEVTGSGRLQCNHIIHAVGPNLNDPSQLGLDRGQLLAFAINNTLVMAEELKCTSVSIPAIATGSFGFPKNRCAQIMFEVVLKYGLDVVDKGHDSTLKYIRFINNDEKTVEAFIDEFDRLLLNSS